MPVPELQPRIEPLTNGGVLIVLPAQGQTQAQPSAAELAPAQVPPDEIRMLLLGGGITVGGVLLAIAIMQFAGYQEAYNVEEFLATQRVSLGAFWLVVGFVASAYRNRILWSGSVVYGKLLSNSDSTALLWPVQAAVAIGLFAGVVLAIHPSSLDRLTSFKAAGVEADFGAGAAKIASAPVRFLDRSRHVELGRWADFKILDVNDADWSSLRRLTPQTLSYGRLHKAHNYRENIYSLSQVDMWRPLLSELIIDEQLHPIFEEIGCFDQLNQIKIIRNDPALLQFAAEFSQFIEKSPNLDTNKRTAQIAYLNEKLSLFSDQSLTTQEEMRLRLKDIMSFVNPEFEQNADIADCKRIASDDSSTLRRSWFPQVHLKTAVNFLPLQNVAASAKLWDLFLIAATADLIAFTDSERSKAEFLERMRQVGSENFLSCTERECSSIVISKLNFFYYINDAKIKSEATWPLDEMITDMRTTITSLDEVLNLNESIVAQSPSQKDLPLSRLDISDAQAKYRLIKLSDLSLALETYYRLALASEPLKAVDVDQWRAWLDETRKILSTVDEIGSVPGLKDASAWVSSQEVINSDPTIVFDAATSAALSLVVIPNASGKVPSEDCLAARSLLNYAREMIGSQAFKEKVAENADEVEPIRGFVDQINARIDGACRA